MEASGSDSTSSLSIKWIFCHLFALCAVAVAQPLYDLLARNPTFFVAHRASVTSILGVVLVCSLLLPVFLTALVALFQLVHRSAAMVLHLALVGALSFLTLLPFLKRATFVPGAVIVIAAAALGIAAALAYRRWPAIRTFASYLAVAGIGFPIWFLGFTPIARQLRGHEFVADGQGEIANPVPIVLVLLDEFSTTALLDDKRQIDSVRFPNLAKLAGDAWWFRNATGTHPFTDKAVPAFLSGRTPTSDPAMTPTVADYPENLFTYLGTRYSQNVFEQFTALCPPELSGSGDAPAPPSSHATLAQDLTIVFLHILAPTSYAKQLPSIDTQWTGFGRPATPVKARTDAPARRTLAFKAFDPNNEQLKGFLANLAARDSANLDFVHLLTPHGPYQFLSTGHSYYPSENQSMPEGIAAASKTWSDQTALIEVAYAQYLQQVGFADRFVGQIIDELQRKGAYERSLIIVTADHGIAFQPNLPQRHLVPEIASDILKVPLIIKLPHQKQGQISDRVTSGIDVLPTISDLLDVTPRWESDGRSVFAADSPPRTEINLPGIGTFPIEQFLDFPRLAWQIERFGTGTPLNSLPVRGPIASLVGQVITELEAGQHVGAPAPLRFHSDVMPFFDDVSLGGSVVPALFAGRISGDASAKPVNLAIGLNNQIWATTSAVPWNDAPGYFATIFPPAAFVNGENDVALFLIDDSAPGTPVLHPIPSDYVRTGGTPRYRFGRDTSGRECLVRADGTLIPVRTGDKFAQGFLDQVQPRGNALLLYGWAADVEQHTPAASVILFCGDQFVAEVSPTLPRPGVVSFLGKGTALQSGFYVLVPPRDIAEMDGEIQAYALTASGVAGLLSVTVEVRNELARLLSREDGTRNAPLKLIRDAHGRDTLVWTSGRSIPLVKSADTGYVDGVESDAATIRLRGWALDRAAFQPVKRVYVFQDDRLLAAARPADRRPDMVAALHRDSVEYCGFSTTISKSSLTGTSHDIRVVAWVNEEVATELAFYGNGRDRLVGFLQAP